MKDRYTTSDWIVPAEFLQALGALAVERAYLERELLGVLRARTNVTPKDLWEAHGPAGAIAAIYVQRGDALGLPEDQLDDVVAGVAELLSLGMASERLLHAAWARVDGRVRGVLVAPDAFDEPATLDVAALRKLATQLADLRLRFKRWHGTIVEGPAP